MADLIYQIAPFAGDVSPTVVLVSRFDRVAHLRNRGMFMAAPQVAGGAALLYSQWVTNPAATEAAIKQFADPDTAGRDADFGYGAIDMRAPLGGSGLTR